MVDAVVSSEVVFLDAWNEVHFFIHTIRSMVREPPVAFQASPQ
jgi:hypothetical protein